MTKKTNMTIYDEATKPGRLVGALFALLYSRKPAFVSEAIPQKVYQTDRVPVVIW